MKKIRKIILSCSYLSEQAARKNNKDGNPIVITKSNSGKTTYYTITYKAIVSGFKSGKTSPNF